MSAASSLLPRAAVQTPKSERAEIRGLLREGAAASQRRLISRLPDRRALGGRNKAFHSYNALAAEDALHVLNRRFLRLRDLLAILEGLHGR